MALLVGSSSAAAAPTATVGFSGGKVGGATGLHFRFTDPENAGSLPEPTNQILVHLPKGTQVNVTGLPQRLICSSDTARDGSCPKASHVGPPGTIHWAAVLDGKRIDHTTRVYPVLGKFGVILDGPYAAPFLTEMTFLPFRDGGSFAAQSLLLSIGVGNVFGEDGSSTFPSVLQVSFTIAASVRVGASTRPLIVMPQTCPKGGFTWRMDYRAFGGVPVSNTTIKTACP